MTQRIVDLTHPIEHGMTTYPGLPAPEISDHLSREASHERYAPGTEFHIGQIVMVGNTGTYLDTPFHRYPDGSDLASTPLERMTELDGVLVDADGLTSIDVELVGKYDVEGKAVLLRTGWSRNWRTDAYFTGHPFLTAEGAAWLVEHRTTLVGIDSLNIDSTATGERPAHTQLLAAGIPIVEHLRGLDELPPAGFRFNAAPAPVSRFGTFPVRAYAVVPS
jgi:kynurenine formamidase